MKKNKHTGPARSQEEAEETAMNQISKRIKDDNLKIA